jgi:restriction system protein
MAQNSSDQIMWMVRAGEGASRIDDFLQKNLIAIGWMRVGNLDLVDQLDQVKIKLKKEYPHFKEGKTNISAATLFKFSHEFEIGQMVVTYNPNEREYWIGEITSEYKFSPSDLDENLPHIRSVKWVKSVSRDSLSTKAKNSLGSTVTIFRINAETIIELMGYVERKTTVSEQPIEEKVTLEEIKEDIESRALEFIKDKITRLDWEDMQELVAGILRGMGYKTFVSPKGADRGRDIMASPDGLGLEDPKIMVEVKHRSGSMGGPEVRSFLGGLRSRDRGMYVSTGGFTKDAKYEAERSNIPITLVDLEMLLQLIVQHYDNFDTETRALIPLKKIYWPIEN